MGSFRDLTVYQKAFDLAMRIFEITKKFPSGEKYEIRSDQKIIKISMPGDWRRVPETAVS